MHKPTFSILFCLLASLASGLAAGADAIKLETTRFTFVLDAQGRPLSLWDKQAKQECLAENNRGRGFYMEGGAGGGKRNFSKLTVVEPGRLVLETKATNGATASVTFTVETKGNYLTFRIRQLNNLPNGRDDALRFELNGNARMRLTELDYMTRVQNETYGVRAHWEYLWHQAPGEPLGGIALLVRQDEDEEDETLLRIWVEEKLAHPQVKGEWTLDRARAWVTDWQHTFADRSQMILEGGSLEELRAALPWAEKARIKEIYLFTQTWRTDNFWPGDHGHIHVNRRIFPKGEEDLRAFSELLRVKGMRLNLHYVSGGIGRTDPSYVGAQPDRRLAGWVRGTLGKAASATNTTLIFQPQAGASYPPDLPHFYEHNHVRIEDEIVRVGAFEIAADGTWILKQCKRGQYLTKAADHAARAECQGLVVAYGQNYVPDNDSTLLDEMAAGFTGLINRCGIAHTEYDGAEIHTYNGRWGYLKFATKVYQNVDHPVTAHDSSGSAPRCNFEYRFNRTQRILRGTCRFTHGNWSAPVQLASPSRVASTVLDANFVLSQGHLGGAMGLCKPEPMFAVSDQSLKAHGLTGDLLETLSNWKAISALLTEEQRAGIDASFGKTPSRMPEHSRHAVSRFVQTAHKTADGYQIVPVCVMTRKQGDILWQQGQEHGAISPRQYVQPGDELILENPFPAQPVKFIVRVLWAFDPQGRSVPLKNMSTKPATSARASDLFTAGNDGQAGAPSKAAPNLMLQPAFRDLRMPKDAPLKTVVSAEGNALLLQAENPGHTELWADVKRLPEWSASMDMTARRGLGLRVTGDGSRALLVFMISGRDYVAPIDFQGPRDIEIPNGEVAWASGDWGWRMETKHADYAHQRGCKIGFGYLPPQSKVSVRVEGIQALAEIPVTLVNPIIHTGTGTLAVKGTVISGQYLQYDGGDTAKVFDENWNKMQILPVEKKNYLMPKGWAPVSIGAVEAKTKPWLEVQFMTEGEAMKVPTPGRVVR